MRDLDPIKDMANMYLPFIERSELLLAAISFWIMVLALEPVYRGIFHLLGGKKTRDWENKKHNEKIREALTKASKKTQQQARVSTKLLLKKADRIWFFKKNPPSEKNFFLRRFRYWSAESWGMSWFMSMGYVVVMFSIVYYQILEEMTLILLMSYLISLGILVFSTHRKIQEFRSNVDDSKQNRGKINCTFFMLFLAIVFFFYAIHLEVSLELVVALILVFLISFLLSASLISRFFRTSLTSMFFAFSIIIFLLSNYLSFYLYLYLYLFLYLFLFLFWLYTRWEKRKDQDIGKKLQNIAIFLNAVFPIFIVLTLPFFELRFDFDFDKTIDDFFKEITKILPQISSNFEEGGGKNLFEVINPRDEAEDSKLKNAWRDICSLFFFFGILPIFNALLDSLSLSVSRHEFERLKLENSFSFSFFLRVSGLDFIFGIVFKLSVLFLLFHSARIYGDFGSFFTLAQIKGYWDQILDLIFTGIIPDQETSLGFFYKDQIHIMISLMIGTTLLPTFTHFFYVLWRAGITLLSGSLSVAKVLFQENNRFTAGILSLVVALLIFGLFSVFNTIIS